MNAVTQAFQLMAIALPTMFGVIFLFMVLIILLKLLFPEDES